MDPWVSSRGEVTTARVRLLCLPHAGGTTHVFDQWRRYAGANVLVCPVQLPGRQNRLREPPITNMRCLVTQLTAVVADRYADRPLGIFGHCLGALVGFEVACELRRIGARQPVHLFASAYAAPAVPRSELPIHTLPDEQFIARLRQLEGTPRHALDNPELMELLLPAVRADFAVLETYEYRPAEPLDCPITVFAGEQDGNVTRSGLLAWRCHTRGPFALRVFPGAHFFFQSSRELVAEVERALDPLAPVSPHIDWCAAEDERQS